MILRAERAERRVQVEWLGFFADLFTLFQSLWVDSPKLASILSFPRKRESILDARLHGHDILRYPVACCGVVHSVMKGTSFK